MATEVKVPSVGESISSGILAVWHVSDGDQVDRDQVLFELETDKITSEGLAEVSGKIQLKVGEGDEVEIGQVVAVIEESEAAPSDDSESKSPSEEEKESSPDDKEQASAREAAEDESPGEEGEDSAKETDSEKSKSAQSVSPAVRRIASETGIDPAEVQGTGKDKRVTKGDMLSAAKQQAGSSTKSPEDSQGQKPAATSSGGEDRITRKKMSGLRKKIADRLVQAQQQAAILTTFNEVDMTAVMQLRKQHQDAFVKKYGHKLGFMSFFVKAVVYALKEVPGINAYLDGQEIVTNHFYDIGIAVGTERGLVVPVVADCDSKSYAEIEGDILNFADKARSGKLAIEDLQGGVFTITNGGIYGSMLSTPILNPPQSGILGMHAIQQRPVAIDGEVVIRPMMYLALSYDHRLVDGQEAVTFLIKVKQAIEDPTRMLFQL